MFYISILKGHVYINDIRTLVKEEKIDHLHWKQ